jgi:hypothetical protein
LFTLLTVLTHPTHGTCYTLPKREELFVGRISKRPPTILTRKDGPHSRETIVRLDLESILSTVNYIKDTTEEAGLIKIYFSWQQHQGLGWSRLGMSCNGIN